MKCEKRRLLNRAVVTIAKSVDSTTHVYQLMRWVWTGMASSVALNIFSESLTAARSIASETMSRGPGFHCTCGFSNRRSLVSRARRTFAIPVVPH